MRQKTLLSKLMLLLCALIVGSSGAWADDTYTLGWGAASGQSGTYTNFTATSGTVSGIVSFSTAKNGGTSDPAYNSNNSDLRLYYNSGGNGGSITLTPASNVTITGFVMTTSTSPSVNYSVDGGTATSVTVSNNTYTVTGISASSSIMIQNVNTSNTQLRIKTIQITYTSSTPIVQTVATPSFSPAAGAVFSGTTVTISTVTEGATIYYTTDNSTPSATNGTQGNSITVTSPTTIKAIAVKESMDDSEVAEAVYTIKPKVTGYTINFENTLDCYVDWTMENIGIHTSGVTSAHGGSAWGSNVNSSDNATQTASIQTKEKVAYPNVFTCYISKESTNNTSSSWKIQVSSDGTTWNDIATLSSMTQNSWTEFTGDIKSAGYTDVYVRLYYSGSNAKRAVDDISLTTYTPAAVEAPSINVPSEFTISTTATITCVTEGATIYYSYDNSTWTEYTGELPINETKTIYAKAVKGTDESTVAQATTTKILATPTVSISTTSINIGATANVTTNGPTVTLTTSDGTIASVNGTTVSGVAAGTATITATWSANSDYAAGTKDFEVTVIDPNAPGSENNPYSVAQAIAATPATGTSANVYIHGKVSSFYNNNSNVTGDNYHRYYISDDGTSTDQLLVFNGKGLNNVAFSNADDLMIGDEITICGGLTTFSNAPEVAKDNYIVSLQRQKKDPTIVVNKTETVAYGSVFTVDNSVIEGGEIRVTSSNTAVATVSGLVITPVAVGTTTITVATEESASYNAGSETFTLTVTQPAGGTSVPVDGYVKVTNSSDLTDGEYLIVYESGNVAFNGGLETLDAQGNYISVSISDNTIASSTTVDAATFIVAAVEGGYSIKSASGSYIGRTGTTNGFNSSATEVYTNTITFNNGNAVITSSGGPTLQYFATSGQERFRYYASTQKSISLYKKVETTLTVKLNGSGYATYCSEYPLDFTNATGYSAWQITSVSGEDITFSQVTGSVKGGTGLLLKGTAGETITLTSSDSNTELSGNRLYGTLAPTYVAADQYYGLSGNQFVKVNAGTVPAGKALLPASEVGSAARLSFVFEDDNTTTGISEELRVKSEESFYNLNGQRVNDLKKGGLYIVGGKKVIVK